MRAAARRGDLCRSCSCSEPDPPDQHVAEHHEVAREAVPGVGERRGTVVLEEEVTDPCEPVAGERHTEQPDRSTRQRGCEQRCNHEHRADEMQPATHRIAVLGQIERIEVREAAEAALRGGRRGGSHGGPVCIEWGPSFLSGIKGVKQSPEGDCYVCSICVVTLARAFRQVTPCRHCGCALIARNYV